LADWIRVPPMTTTDLDDDLTRRDWLAEEFERHRGHLRAVGYRMLGSVRRPITPPRRPGCGSTAATEAGVMTSGAG
jgi:hypothetical protein